MSRGLGKWERFVMDALTYPTEDKHHDEFFLWSYHFNDIVGLYFTSGHGNTSPEEGGLLESACYSKLDAKEICIYQSIARAVRSLERKGFIKSDIVPPDPREKRDFAEDGIFLKDYKEVSFNNKCLAKGIPWQLKYLNKRFWKKKTRHLFINKNGGI